MRGPANRAPSHIEPVSRTIEPVSGVPKRKLKNGEQRLGPEKRPSRTRRPRIDAQRLRHASLSHRNVGGTRAPGNDTAETGLAGWRRSADGPLLCPFSLQTGNFTGNFAKSRLLARQRLQIVASLLGFRRDFPTQRNRELFQRSREFWRRNREIYLPNRESFPDKIFGTHTANNR